MPTNRERLSQLLADGRVIRYRDLASAEGGPIPSVTLMRMVKEKLVVPEAAGYRLAVAPGLSLAAARIVEMAQWHPNGILCLYSAITVLDYVGCDVDLTDNFTAVDTVALPLTQSLNSRTKLHGVKIISFANPDFFKDGVEETVIAGVRVRYTNLERTVADMFNGGKGLRLPVEREHALKALGKIMRARGEDGLNAVDGYAYRLGWGFHTQPVIDGMKEAMQRCAPPTP